MLPTNPLLNATAPAGPHLPAALLRQYAAGTLAPAAQHRVEAHTLGCPRCADILAGLLQTPAATTDQAVAQLQQRLRQRVQQVAPARQGQRLAPRRPRWLSLQLAAAAALLLSMVAGGWWAWRQRQAPPQVATSATLPAAAGPAATAPLASPTPAAVPEALPTPAVAPPTAPLAHLGARRPHRRAAPASAAAPLRAAQAAEAPEVVIPAPAAAPVPDLIASQAPHRPDSLSPAPATKPLVASRSFTTDPAHVRDAAMPAARKIAPMPMGGMASLREQLRREAAEFVPEVPERSLSGTVQLRLTIGTDGKLEAISVLRGLRADYDAEAQRLVRDGPAWVPGISGGRRAALQVDVAVPF
ncbi:energy transducer TonB [Hymenobacter bucti]|uniref:Energy transducer TonB n=1 Tax=Hymenobacter bucti TaxID=1844114 RepID=A0ABW4QN61_9BACT